MGTWFDTGSTASSPVSKTLFVAVCLLVAASIWALPYLTFTERWKKEEQSLLTRVHHLLPAHRSQDTPLTAIEAPGTSIFSSCHILLKKISKKFRQQSPCTQDPPPPAHSYFLDPLGVLASCWVCREFPHSLTRGTALLIQVLDLQIPTPELVLVVEGAVRTCSSIFNPMLGQLLHLGLLTSLALRSGDEQTHRV